MSVQTIKFSVGEHEVELHETKEIVDLLLHDNDFTYSYFEKAITEGKLVHFGVTATQIKDVDIIERHVVEEDIGEIVENIEGSDHYTSQTYNENIASGSSSLSNAAETTEKEVTCWTDSSTKLLLSLYKEIHPKVGKTVNFKNKKYMWKYISMELAKLGYVFTEQQVENRYKTLDRGFKEKTVHNKKTGRNRASCLFEKELTEININRKAIFPEYILDSTGSGKNEITLRKEAGIETDNVMPSTAPTAAKKPRTVLHEIQKIRERNEKVDEQKHDLELEKHALQRKALEIEMAKLEAYKVRTEAIQTKNALLKQLIEELHNN